MIDFLKKSFLSLALLAALSAFAAGDNIKPVAFVGDPPPEVDGSMERMPIIPSYTGVAGPMNRGPLSCA